MRLPDILTRLIFIGGTLASITGCAHFPLNAPLDHLPSAREVPQDPTPESLVVLSLSGGGTRAAAFSYGVLEALKETPSTEGRSLLEEVDLISAVSGGSLVAVSYALDPESFFEDFPKKVLYHNVQRDLLHQLYSPRNWFRLASSDFERIDLVGEYFEECLFDDQSFGDLPSHPEVIVNATDITRGARFDFTRERFAALCSDLDSYSLGRAVAASAAVPVVLSPITLENFGWEQCHYRPPWSQSPEDASPRAARRFETWSSYEDANTRRYLHLLDGGLVDNLGLEALLDEVFSTQSPCDAARRRGLREVRDVLVIVVNAVTDLDRKADLLKEGPSLVETVWAAANIPIDRHSFQTIDLLQDKLSRWSEALEQCENGQVRPERMRVIVVDFNGVTDVNLRQQFKSLPTTFSLPESAVDSLRKAGRDVLRRQLEAKD